MKKSQPTETEAKPALGAPQASRFGAMIRDQRQSLKMTQDDLALATGVGRRFIIDLEAGKPSCELGKALLVAETLGLRLFDLLQQDRSASPILPELPDDEGAQS